MKTFFRYFCTAHLALTVGLVWILAASIIKGAPPTTTITATKNDNVPGSTSLPPGSNINYTIQISNTGAVSATNLSISDPTPANTTFVAGSLHASPIAVNDSITMVSNVKFYGGVTPPAGQPAVTGSGLFANDITTTDSTILASNSSPSHGTATVNNDGTFIYPPDADFTGADSFTYTVKNNVDATLTDTATVSITVNAPPVAIADGPTNYAAPVNQQLGRTAPGVLRNDTLNGATLTGYGATTGTEQTTIGSATPTAQGGSIVLRADGSFTYTPPAGFSGNDTFKYTLTASLGSGTLVNGAGSSTAVVTIYLDTLPAVTSTVPANNATGVGINSTITINFSEPVDTSAAFSISPNITFSQSPTDGNATSAFTLTPSAALTPGQLYTVTVANFQVADVDGGLSPASNYVFSFTVLPVPAALNDPDTQGSRYQVTENVTYDSALASP
ncbi:MAG TPA: Ig-like domain-containing protein, partial [Verrucomicrobiae bacterium]|nr:Ig-like domain-containing protein [Verrucomicrobiae bacterium]